MVRTPGNNYDLHFSLSLQLFICSFSLGSYDINLASLLYQLGPESPPSCIVELGDILTSSYVEMASDVTEVKQTGISDAQLQAIQVNTCVYKLYIVIIYY